MEMKGIEEAFFQIIYESLQKVKEGIMLDLSLESWAKYFLQIRSFTTIDDRYLILGDLTWILLWEEKNMILRYLGKKIMKISFSFFLLLLALQGHFLLSWVYLWGQSSSYYEFAQDARNKSNLPSLNFW